jgi:thiol-disulfide isomerase/thioredoxin
VRRLCCYLTVLLAISACNPSATNWQLEILDPAAPPRHTLLAREARGKRIFINYWAEWCKPCITEIPELNQFARLHPDSVIVLGFNFDQKQGAELLAAMEKVAIAFPAIRHNPAAVFALPEIGGLPTTLVLDEQGRLITALTGPQTTATLEEALSIP